MPLNEPKRQDHIPRHKQSKRGEPTLRSPLELHTTRNELQTSRRKPIGDDRLFEPKKSDEPPRATNPNEKSLAGRLARKRLNEIYREHWRRLETTSPQDKRFIDRMAELGGRNTEKLTGDTSGGKYQTPLLIEFMEKVASSNVGDENQRKTIHTLVAEFKSGGMVFGPRKGDIKISRYNGLDAAMSDPRIINLARSYKLTAAETLSVIAYTTDLYSELNSPLRRGDSDERTQAWNANLNSALKKIAAKKTRRKENVLLGTSIPFSSADIQITGYRFDDGGKDFMQQRVKASSFTDSAPLSTGTALDGAVDAAETHSALTFFQTPEPGTQGGANISGLSYWGRGEKEVLYPSKTEFKVKKSYKYNALKNSYTDTDGMQDSIFTEWMRGNISPHFEKKIQSTKQDIDHEQSLAKPSKENIKKLKKKLELLQKKLPETVLVAEMK